MVNNCTDSACLIASVAALGMYVASRQKRNNFFETAPKLSYCGTDTEPVSARAAAMAVGGTEGETSFLEGSDLFPQIPADTMPDVGRSLPNGGANTQKTRDAKKQVQANLNMEVTGGRTIGLSTLVAGRSASETLKQPEVKGGECMFYMSDAYADKLMSQEE